MFDKPVITDLGTDIDYQQAWDLQKDCQNKLINKLGPESILFCEHSPTLTYGSSAELEKVLLISKQELDNKNIKLIKSDRGGNITYHGPGQLVCYPIIDLSIRRPDINYYLRTIEKIVLKTLFSLGIQASCIKDKTGIWTSENEKICSIGVRFSRWCSMHGFSLNLRSNCQQGFSLIHPCGMNNITASSIQSCTGLAPDRQQVIDLLTENILQSFYTENENRIINAPDGRINIRSNCSQMEKTNR